MPMVLKNINRFEITTETMLYSIIAYLSELCCLVCGKKTVTELV